MDELDYALLPLAARAEESRQGGIFRDARAEEWHRYMCQESHLPLGSKLDPMIQAGLALRTLVIDYAVIGFVNDRRDLDHQMRIYEMGCGYSTRPYRLRSLPTQWVNVDRPQVMQLRQELPGIVSWDEVNISANFGEDDFHTFDESNLRRREALFIFEGVLTYLPLEKVQRMLRLLRGFFPEAAIIGTAVKRSYAAGGLPIEWAISDLAELEALLDVKISIAWSLSELSHRLGFRNGPKLPDTAYIWLGSLKLTPEQESFR